MLLRSMVVYGPVKSRRLGQSLGINLLPTTYRLCSFGCVYCQYGMNTYRYMTRGEGDGRFAPLGFIKAEMSRMFPWHLEQHTRIDSITLSGNGEPTLYPQFEAVVDYLLQLRDRLFPDTPTSIFTDGLHFDDPDVCIASLRLDNRFIKIDAGDQETFRLIDRPYYGAKLDQIVSTLQHLRPFVLSTAVMQGKVSNFDSIMSDGYAKIVSSSRPKEIHLYSIDRLPPDSGIETVSRQTLEFIADWLSKKTGTKVRVLQDLDMYYDNVPQHLRCHEEFEACRFA